MATLSKNSARAISSGGLFNNFAMIIDIIFLGAAVGLVDGTGYARPLADGDRFVGFCDAKIDNSAGAAADLNVSVQSAGTAFLAVAGAVITDVGQPVYATDDDTFVFNPTGGSFVGFVRRFDSAGYAEVAFDIDNFSDPYGDGVRELVSVNKTLDVEDTGKTFFVDTDAVVITLPVTAVEIDVTIVNIGAFGAVAVNVDPAAADKIQGPDLAGANNKDLINTKATARRGDLVRLVNGQADGAMVLQLVGTWATEA